MGLRELASGRPVLWAAGILILQLLRFVRYYNSVSAYQYTQYSTLAADMSILGVGWSAE